MGRHRSSTLAGLVVTAAIAVPSMAFVMQNAADNSPQQQLELTSSTGAVSISNSAEGQAILSARPMLPGQQATGTVQLTNSGDGDESMVLDAGTPVDQPGPGGGRLSERLRLRVDDVTSGSAHTVYDGALTGLHLTDLGTWSQGESRTYRFVVTFPDGGANGADNAYQGSSASIGFTWTAGAAGPSAPPADAPYTQQIAYDQPLAYWPLDGSQATMDDAAGSHDGQFSNSVTTGTVTAPGGGSPSWFDGTTSYGYVPSLPAPHQAYTLEAWVLPAGTGNMLIADHGGGPALGILDGHFVFRQTDTVLTSSTTVEANRWWHLVGTWDASTGDARLYVDGHLSAELSAPTAPSGEATFYVGRGSWTGFGAGASGEFFHGDIAQIGYYPQALSADRVAAHWDSGRTAATTPPAAPPTAPGESTPPAPAPSATPSEPAPSSTPPGGDTSTTPAPPTCPKVVAQGGKAKPKPKPKPKHKKPSKKRPAKHKPAKHKPRASTQRVCTAPMARTKGSSVK